jgi:hypothetical protein
VKAYVVSWTEKGKFQTMTLYVKEKGKLEEFVTDLQKKGCQVNEVKLAKQQDTGAWER